MTVTTDVTDLEDMLYDSDKQCQLTRTNNRTGEETQCPNEAARAVIQGCPCKRVFWVCDPCFKNVILKMTFHCNKCGESHMFREI